MDQTEKVCFRHLDRTIELLIADLFVDERLIATKMARLTRHLMKTYGRSSAMQYLAQVSFPSPFGCPCLRVAWG